jgi:hypothetical protein
MNPIAVIETDDGARVRFEARRFARRSDKESRIWAVAARLRFASEHERYLWLDDALSVWEGELDAEAHRARHQAYVVRDDGTRGRRYYEPSPTLPVADPTNGLAACRDGAVHEARATE